VALCVCEAPRCNAPVGLRVYPDLQGVYFSSMHQTPFPLIHLYTLLSSRKVLRCSVKRKWGGGLPLPPSPPPPVWNKAAFWGGVLSCIAQQEEQGNKQGQIHQTEGVALQDEERWVLIKVQQQRREGSKWRESADSLFCLRRKKTNRKLQQQQIAWWDDVTLKKKCKDMSKWIIIGKSNRFSNMNCSLSCKN